MSITNSNTKLEDVVKTSESTQEVITPKEDNITPKEEVVPETDTYEPSDEVKQFVEDVYVEYKELASSLNIDVNNFILLVTKTLERVNKIKKLNDQEKYSVVVLILDRLVDEIPNTDEIDRYYLRNMTPSLIQIVLDASKGKLKLNVKKLKRKRSVDVRQVIDDLYQQIKDIITNNHYTAEYICTNVVVIVGMLMTAVEQYPGLTGMEKKAIVIKIFDRLIDDLVNLFPDMDPSLKGLVNQARMMLPSVIDMLVSVGRNHYQIVKKKCGKLFSCCKSSQ